MPSGEGIAGLHPGADLLLPALSPPALASPGCSIEWDPTAHLVPQGLGQEFSLHGKHVSRFVSPDGFTLAC